MAAPFNRLTEDPLVRAKGNSPTEVPRPRIAGLDGMWISFLIWLPFAFDNAAAGGGNGCGAAATGPVIGDGATCNPIVATALPTATGAVVKPFATSNVKASSPGAGPAGVEGRKDAKIA